MRAAAKRCDAEKLQAILENKDAAIDLNEVDAEAMKHQTALMMACDARSSIESAKVEAVVTLLLEAKADASLQDKDGNTALHLAAKSGRVEVASLLLGKARTSRGKKEMLSVRAEKPAFMPLHLVKTVEMAEMLLSNGADWEAGVEVRGVAYATVAEWHKDGGGSKAATPAFAELKSSLKRQSSRDVSQSEPQTDTAGAASPAVSREERKAERERANAERQAERERKKAGAVEERQAGSGSKVSSAGAADGPDDSSGGVAARERWRASTEVCGSPPSPTSSQTRTCALISCAVVPCRVRFTRAPALGAMQEREVRN